MSLYADYILEREGRNMLESEHGFLTYIISGPDCYVVDFFVEQKFRRSGKGKLLADHIERIAKESGCTRLLGSIVPTAKGSTESLKVLLSYGYKLLSSRDNFMMLYKDVV